MRAILDSCVLFPAPLRDLFMNLALLDVFEARWTNEIHDEWIRSVLKTRPDLSEKQLLRTRRLMDLHARDGLVDGYRHLIDGLKLPDHDDRHVLAAAIHCGAEEIVTFNLKDFPRSRLKEFGIEATTPDRFVSTLFKEHQENICFAFARQLESLRNPPKTRNELFEILKAQGLDKTVELLRSCKEVSKDISLSES